MDGRILWRATRIGLALVQAIGLVGLLLTQGFPVFSIYEPDFLHYGIAGFACALWSVEHARRGWRVGAPLVAALVATALAATWIVDTAAIGASPRGEQHAGFALIVAAFTLPPLLYLAHRQRRAAAIAGAGALLLVAGVALTAWRYRTEGLYEGGPPVALQLAGAALALAGALLAARDADAWPLVRTALPVSGLVGMLLLALSWWFGGQVLLLIPLWILAPLALAAPALLAARARPARALAAVALLTAGAFVPAATCTYPFVTDAPRPDDPQVAKIEVEPVWRVAGRGPWWEANDLFATYPVRCEPRLPLVAIAWLAGLVLVAWPRWPEPRWPKLF